MPIFVGNASIEAGSGAFRIKDSSSNTLFEQGVSTYGGQPFSYYLNNSTPAFIAGSASDPGWVAPASSGAWGKINNYCTTTVYNRGSHYSTANTRFTCPVTGPYLFMFSTYAYTSNYFHPGFYVNGTATGAGRLNFTYRIRGYGFVANYQQDAQIEEVLYCTAGDYVEAYWYSGGNSYSYPYYSLFMGAYVG